MVQADVFKVDIEKCKELVRIKRAYITGQMSFDEARKELTSRFDSVTPEEFAYGEQQLKEDGVEDGEMQDRMDELLRLFDGILKGRECEELPEGHPIRTFLEENKAMEGLVSRMKALLKKISLLKMSGWKSMTDCYCINAILPVNTISSFPHWKPRGLTDRQLLCGVLTMRFVMP